MAQQSGGSSRLLGPFNRVEGDLEVRIAADDQQLLQAWVNAPLFRGYEQILQGKDPRDALVYTPRICGICSVAQSVAASQTLAAWQGIVPPANGQLATNLILAAENMADHLTHFYLFFMPDFARDCYQTEAWHAETAARFRAQTGTMANQVLPARSAFLHITGLLAGKWPHSLAIQPGGTSRPLQPQEQIRLQGMISTFRYFLQEVLFGVELEQMAELESEAELWQLVERTPHSDLSRFLYISRELQLQNLGRAYDNFMSYGAYAGLDGGGPLFRRGVWVGGEWQALDESAISEDISHSWLDSQTEPKHPYQGRTIPGVDAEAGYSWCKAPRLDGRVVEVGALARQMVAGHPLIRELVANLGGNVQNRVVARLLELALVVPQMEQWAKQLRSHESYCVTPPLPDEGQGAGMMEAARGSLGHWLRVKNGNILNYQIIAPTTWNFSPRDHLGQPGALELALQGTPLREMGRGEASIQHIIRSFDPCMVCTVH